MVLIVTIRPQSIFLIVARVSWYSFIGVDLLYMGLELFVYDRLRHWRGVGRLVVRHVEADGCPQCWLQYTLWSALPSRI